MRYILSLCLIVVGVIHLLPLTGVLGVERLQSLYGIALDDPNLVLLMRHRAVLFGTLGTVCVAAAFWPALQLPALVLGAVSVLSFLLLSVASGPLNASLARVVVADWIALAALVLGAAMYAMLRR